MELYIPNSGRDALIRYGRLVTLDFIHELPEGRWLWPASFTVEGRTFAFVLGYDGTALVFDKNGLVTKEDFFCDWHWRPLWDLDGLTLKISKSVISSSSSSIEIEPVSDTIFGAIVL